MKIRNDFVTNSSSSSFILAFRSENTMDQELEGFKNQEDFETVYNDCLRAEKMDLEQMLQTAVDEMKWNVKFYVECQAEKRGMNYRDVLAWSKSPEFDKCVEKEIQRRLDLIKDAAGDSSVFVLVSYSDNDGDGELEHYIVPNLDCCVASFSHH